MSFSQYGAAKDRRPDDPEVLDVCDRWRVRYQRSQLHVPVSACPAAPDIRSSYLHARAAFIAKDGRLASAPRVEDELHDTLKELAATREESNRVAEENAALAEKLEAERAARAAAEAEKAAQDELVDNLHAKVEALERKLEVAQRPLVRSRSSGGQSFYMRHTSSSTAAVSNNASFAKSPSNDVPAAEDENKATPQRRVLRGASPVRPGASPASANRLSTRSPARPPPRPVSSPTRTRPFH
jgi:hypothetical protein